MTHRTLRRFSLPAVLAFGLLAFAFHPFAQVRSPSRGNAQTPIPTGSGRIRGLVVTDEGTSKPVRHAMVTLAAGDLLVPRMTATDDNGRFEFAALAAGNYTLMASRAGYVRMFYGAKKPGRGPGVPIAVIAGQPSAPIVMRLPRGSVITGVVRNSSGLPVPDSQVMVMQVQATAGQRRLLPALHGATTDDRGIYRVFGLAPGEYIVQVQPRIGQSEGELRQVTSSELQWADQAMASAGGAAGAPSQPVPPPPEPGRLVSYAPVYYPGTTVMAEATLVTLGVGEETIGIDLSLQLVPTAKLTGTVIDAEGRLQTEMAVSLRPSQTDSTDLLSMMMGGANHSTGDGAFTLNGVKPGRYTLTVRGTPRSEASPVQSDAERMRQMMTMMPGLGGGASHWAMQDIVVDGRDLSDLTLRLQPGMSVAGKIVFDASSLTPPEDLSRARLTISGASSGSSVLEMAMSFMTSLMATTAADGTFVARSLTPGRYRLSVMAPGLRPSPTAPGPGWMLKSIMWNGRDVADLPLEIKPNEDVTDLIVTLTDRPTELSGAVLDQAGRPTSSFPIVVFSTNRTYWTMGSRRVQQGRPASSGKYLIAGLPAGEYYVCAVTDLDASDLSDPAFLEQLIAGSFKITLAEAERKTQDLKLAGG